MNRLLKLEEIGLFLLSLVLFARSGYDWWVFPVLLLLPDLGMIGYALGPAFGATTYNLAHHRGLAVVFYAVGSLSQYSAVALLGLIIVGQSSLDRVFGYGLKYPDSFYHTHLGWFGPNRRAQA